MHAMATETETPGLVADVRRLLELRRMKDELSKQEKPINSEIDAIEARVVEQMGLDGVDSLGVDGYTISRTTTPYASVKEGCKEKLIEALEQMGLTEKLVTINHSAFKARVAEWLAEDAVPSGLAPLIKIFDKHGLSVRKR
jgi:hypothetical protein